MHHHETTATPCNTGRSLSNLHSRGGSAFGDHRFVVRVGAALILANCRYWLTIAPLVRAQLRRWEQHARAIHDPILRALALDKLREESFNAEGAAMLATIAPRAHRASAVEAIIALEILYDYLDGLSESSSHDALRDGHRLFGAFTDAVAQSVEPDRDYYRYHPRSEDGGYVSDLVATVRTALSRLPAIAAIAEVAQKSAIRGAEAQTRAHATLHVGTKQIERWAMRQAKDTALQWREFLAGAAASVLAVHALIAAATDHRTTREQAVAIDTAYLSISALTTMLDSLIDYRRDMLTGEHGYIRYYEDHDLLAQRLAGVARHAATQARALPKGAHHVMILVGVVAYYTSAPDATSAFAQPVAARIGSELRPLIAPTLAVMHVWRTAKRLNLRWRDTSPATANQTTASL